MDIRSCVAALVLCVTGIASAGRTDSVSAIRVSPGWNLLSLPVSVSIGVTDSLFPSATSGAFVYRTTYQEADTLESGSGFWLKFAAAETVHVRGEMLLKDTIEVQAGWNVIGSLSQAFARASIQTWPPGIIAGQVFEYVPGAGYRAVDTLRPGFGYWVKSAEYGFVMLAAPGGQACPGTPTVDYAGRTYNTVLIGNQCWLKENMDVGTMIPGAQGQVNNGTFEKYCYGDIAASCDTFGGLYQWDEAMLYDTAQSVRGICPPGWHLPAVADYDTLFLAVGGDGNALKAVGQGLGVGAGTNTSGFSALLAGFRSHDGTFGSLRGVADIQSSTQIDATHAQNMGLWEGDSQAYLFNGQKQYGFSVRCIRDQ
jgi:uncharacterized protein (TIGR02145 family)